MLLMPLLEWWRLWLTVLIRCSFWNEQLEQRTYSAKTRTLKAPSHRYVNDLK